MSIYNGSVAKRQRATEKLRIALQGESSEHINRVLALMIQLDIDPDEEFFLIVAAIGHLKILVEDAPQEWQGLFKSFVRELRQWATLNTEHLKLLTSKTQTIEHLAQSCARLASSLELLQVISQELTRQLKTSTSLSTELSELRQELKDLKEDRSNLKEQLADLTEKDKSNLEEQLTDLTKELVPLKQLLEENWMVRWSNSWGVVVVAGLIVAIAANSWSLLQIKNRLAETEQIVNWSMTKLERIENKLGIAPSQH